MSLIKLFLHIFLLLFIQTVYIIIIIEEFIFLSIYLFRVRDIFDITTYINILSLIAHYQGGIKFVAISRCINFFMSDS